MVIENITALRLRRVGAALVHLSEPWAPPLGTALRAWAADLAPPVKTREVIR